VALSHNLQPFADLLGVDQNTVRTVLNSWGPGRFDVELPLDGKAFRPDGKSGSVLIPPAFGLAGVNLHTWTGWGSVPYWNAFVAILEMHGKGNFFDPRLDDAAKFPIAAKAGEGHVHNSEDLVTGKLSALQFYQLAIAAPAPPHGSFDKAAARRGKELFDGTARSSTCHTEPLTTEPGWDMPLKFALMTSRPAGLPMTATGLRRSTDSGLTLRAASTMTDASPPCRM